MIARIRRWFAFREVSLPKEMATLWGTEQTASVKYAKPERAKVHEFTDNDAQALEAAEQAHPKVLNMKARGK